jgi:hypothetical protein
MKRARIISTSRSKVSKADAQALHIPSTDNVPQEDIAENPISCTEVSFVLRKVIRGQLTTRESIIRGCPSKAGIAACGYGAEVKRSRRNNDFQPSNKNGDGRDEVARDCDREIKR